jgi:hypothetical protein
MQTAAIVAIALGLGCSSTTSSTMRANDHREEPRRGPTTEGGSQGSGTQPRAADDGATAAVAATTDRGEQQVPDHRATRAEPEPTGPPPMPRRVPERGCVPVDDAPIAALENEARVATENSFNDTLAKQGLRRAPLPVRQHTLHEGISGNAGPRAPSYPHGQVVDATIEGVRGRYVAGGAFWGLQAQRPDFWEFVRDGKGVWYRVVRAAQPSALSAEVFVCTCDAHRCGPYGSGCPACGLTAQQMYGPLPTDAVYGGEVEIRYQAASVTVRADHTGCKSVPRCPPPPPSSRP